MKTSDEEMEFKQTRGEIRHIHILLLILWLSKEKTRR
jgi:hypothetical protein